MAEIINFDESAEVDLIFRKNRSGSKVFTFTDADGDPYNISALTFRVNVRPNNSDTNSFQLTTGSGLTIGTNTITVSVSSTQTNQPETLYFWELEETTTNKIWIFGTAQFITRQPHDSDNSGITINLSTISITVTGSGGLTSVDGGTI